MQNVGLLLLYLGVGAVMYFTLIRPRQQREKQHRELIAQLTEGDEVLTSSGLYGFVAALDGDVLWLEVSPGVELKVARSSVASTVNPDDDLEDED